MKTNQQKPTAAEVEGATSATPDACPECGAVTGIFSGPHGKKCFHCGACFAQRREVIVGSVAEKAPNAGTLGNPVAPAVATPQSGLMTTRNS